MPTEPAKRSTITMHLAAPGESGLGSVVTGLDLGECLAPAAAEALRRAYVASPVLCIRGGGATPDSFQRLARVFGMPQIQLLGAYRDRAFPAISYIERGQRDTLGDGKRVTFGAHWHTDDSYMAVPCSSTLLYGDVVPTAGGDTSFVNMHAAYEALPEALKTRIAGLRAVHAYQSRRNVSPVPKRTEEEEARTPPVSHPLVRTYPETGRKALYLNPNRIRPDRGPAPRGRRRAPRPADRPRHPARLRPCPCLAHRRHRDLGQPVYDA